MRGSLGALGSSLACRLCSWLSLAAGWAGSRTPRCLSGVLGLKRGGGLTEGLHVAARDDVLDLPGWMSNRLPTVVPKASLDMMVCGRLGALPLPSVCSAWSYKLQLLTELGRYRIVHCRGWRPLTLPALTRWMERGTEWKDVGVWPEHVGGLSLAGVERFCAESLAMSQAPQAE